MSALSLPSFDVHPFSPPAPPDGSFGITVEVTVEEAADRTPVWVLSGAYRLPDLLGPGVPSVLGALGLVAIELTDHLPTARKLSAAQVEAAPPDLTPAGTREGRFALDLVRLFNLTGHMGWLSVVCSVREFTSNVADFETLGG